MRLSSDGLPFILPPALACAGLFAAGQSVAGSATALATAAIAAFFRDPERTCDAPAGHLASPADGRVVGVERRSDGRVRVAIFLSVFNVHVARSPATGRLVWCRRIPGPLRAAFDTRAGENARVRMDLETDHGPIELSLMAGLVARRVLPWVDAPSSLHRGQRIAIIRFGSRAEIVLPPGFEATVENGARVRAGQTVIARPEPPKRAPDGT